MMPLRKVVIALQSADLSLVELLQLAKKAPTLKTVWEKLINKKRQALKTCTRAQRKAIDKFIQEIGYEITPAQPDEDQMASLLAVPQYIKKRLLALLPYAKDPLMDLLNRHAQPYDNLDEVNSWLSALEALFIKLGHATFPPTQKRLFNHIFTFTDQVGLRYATLAMDMVTEGEFTLDKIKPFLDELEKIKPNLMSRQRLYEPFYYGTDDLLGLLEQDQSPYLPLLTAQSLKQEKSLSRGASLDPTQLDSPDLPETHLRSYASQ